MTGFISVSSSAFDYIQSNTPSDPQNGEMWFDTDGGSDGTGEAKVYDAASGGWDVTGYTSHGDLTDATRDAHHPPVDVSGPLTQPADQSLGLSIGDGLADSAGTLVANLGNGLAVDADGQVYVPAGAVSRTEIADSVWGQWSTNGNRDLNVYGQRALVGFDGGGLYLGYGGDFTEVDVQSAPLKETGSRVYSPNNKPGTADLSFDPATQNELNNHVGDGAAHHTKPTGADAVGVDTQTVANSSGDISTIGNGETKSTSDRDRGLMIDRMRCSFDFTETKDTRVDLELFDVANNSVGGDSFRGLTPPNYLEVTCSPRQVDRGVLTATNYDSDFQDVTNVEFRYHVVGAAAGHGHNIS
ncbi:hypothetical protein BRC97_07055 [Halobacteriales archaeon QS_6_71_20]|nr:MAG: hypothetical protein BRC97_07055 [Halobacteriales archaeon QS_6_71_20]